MSNALYWVDEKDIQLAHAHARLAKTQGSVYSKEYYLSKKSPGTWHVGAQGGRDDELGCWGDEGIAVSISIIAMVGFNTVNWVTHPITPKKSPNPWIGAQVAQVTTWGVGMRVAATCVKGHIGLLGSNFRIRRESIVNVA